MSNPTSNQNLESTINHHHVHRDDEPLPGVRGAEPTVDYTPETLAHTRLPTSEEGNTQDFAQHPRTHKNEPFDQSRTHQNDPFDQSRTHQTEPLDQARAHINEPHGHDQARAHINEPHGHGHSKTHHDESLGKDRVGGGLGDDHVPTTTAVSGSGAGSTTKASFGDKLVGTTQELAGKVLKKEGLQEKGEMRKQGDKV